MQSFCFKPQIITIYTVSINVKKEVLRKYNKFRKGKSNSIYGKDEEIRESFIRQVTNTWD